MNWTETTGVTPRALGLAAWLLGVLGLVFCWWLPLGVVLCIAGMLTAFIGWVRLPDKTGHQALFLSAIVLCILALGVNVVVAARGLDLIQLTSFQR